MPVVVIVDDVTAAGFNVGASRTETTSACCSNLANHLLLWNSWSVGLWTLLLVPPEVEQKSTPYLNQTQAARLDEGVWFELCVD